VTTLERLAPSRWRGSEELGPRAPPGQLLALAPVPDVLEAVAIESKRVIDIDEFVPKDEIDELYLNNPYYIRPDGEVGQQASAVIREAIRKEGHGRNRQGRVHVPRAHHCSRRNEAAPT
jgi:hypothetical protein